MAVRFCGHCGEHATTGDRFCVGCGQRLRDTGTPPDAATALPATAGPSVPADDRVVLQHALRLLARREHLTAVHVLEGLCAERPDWPVARAYLGIAYLRSTRIAESRWELEEAVRQAPESFICRSKYGEFLARLGFYDQGMAQLDLALELSAPDSETRHAAIQLRQFCKDKSKGIFYRNTAYPKLGRLLPRRHHVTKLQVERGN